MYLKKLEINGFKSFGKKSDFDFKTKITAIVGPNGSGKSNVAEAFRFVLGEQSIKNMRGKKGGDLIFSGKNGSLSKANVKLFFDNSKKILDIDYREVILERAVLRDGENEYLINGNKVRAKDIVELLSSANIGPAGHHIISQGEADKILSVSPKERKNIIEEALGLKTYTMKKSEASRKMERTRENLKEAKTREKINAPRIKFLEKEVEKIEKIKNLKEELFLLYQNFFPKRFKILEEKKYLDKKIEEKDFEKNEIEEKINSLKNKKENFNSNSQNIENENLLIQIKGKINILEEKLEEKTKNFAKLEFREENILQTKNNFPKTNESLEEKKENILNIIKNVLEEIPQEKSLNLADKILEFFGYGQKKEVESLENGNENENLEKIKEEKNIIKTEILKLKEEKSALFEEKNKLEILKNGSGGEEKNLEIEILNLEKKLSFSETEKVRLFSQKREFEKNIENFVSQEIKMISVFGNTKAQEILSLKDKSENFQTEEKNLLEKISRILILLENTNINFSEDFKGEYEELKNRQDFVKKEVEDLEKSLSSLEKIILELTAQIEERFHSGILKINSEFKNFFKLLFSGGEAEIKIVKIPIKNSEENDEEKKEFELGIEIFVSLPNKKISSLSMLSGGERSLTSIALLFAMSQVTPPPFIILDETDAALDEANSKRYGDMAEKLAKNSQLILITHNRETMSRAGILYGVTMDNSGISKILSVSLEEAEGVAK